MRPPEALLPRNPTWESSHFSGLATTHTPLTKGPKLRGWTVQNHLFHILPLNYLEDRNLLRLRSLDPSCPLFLGDNSIWGQRTQMLQML